MYYTGSPFFLRIKWQLFISVTLPTALKCGTGSEIETTLTELSQQNVRIPPIDTQLRL
jgi:hypothetical protein